MNQVKMRLFKDINIKAVVCDSCKGKPDYIYFNDATNEILSIICEPCKEVIEATLSSIGQLYADGGMAQYGNQ